MNISSFTVRWLSLFLGPCSTCTSGLFSVRLLVCSVLKLLAEGGDGRGCGRAQWSGCASYPLWQVCLLWFVCEGPRQTPKGMLLPSPAQGVWPWSRATTPRVDSLPWRNSLVSLAPGNSVSLGGEASRATICWKVPSPAWCEVASLLPWLMSQTNGLSVLLPSFSFFLLFLPSLSSPSLMIDHGKTVNVEANLVLTEEGNYVSGFVILTQI